MEDDKVNTPAHIAKEVGATILAFVAFCAMALTMTIFAMLCALSIFCGVMEVLA